MSLPSLEQLKSNERTRYIALELERVLSKQKETQKMVSQKDMAELAHEELQDLAKQEAILYKQIESILKKEEEEEEFPNEIVLEVRAGAGGDEAGLFAHELAQSYLRYAEKERWKWNLIDESCNDMGGYKEASFEIHGKDVYKKLQYETGVHRVSYHHHINIKFRYRQRKFCT